MEGWRLQTGRRKEKQPDNRQTANGESSYAEQR